MILESQYDIFLKHLITRKRNPAKPATVAAYKSYWKTHIVNELGKLELSKVENGVMKKFVLGLSEKGLSASSIASITQLLKGIVASSVDSNGNSLENRAWNTEFIDSPPIEDQKTPTIAPQGITQAIEGGGPTFGPLFALLGGSGLRIWEI